MNEDIIKGKWLQLGGKLKEKWGKLTDADVTQLAGHREYLIGKLQERYGIKKEDAQTRANEWLDSVPTMPEETSSRR